MARVENLSIVYLPPAAIVGYARNSRTHSDAQVAQIAASIREFGFTNPILIDEEGTIIAGHGRLAAAERLKLESVPTITLAGLTDAQRRALVIADNKLAENAGWDFELLSVELDELRESGFDLSLVGFSAKELADLVGDPSDPGTPPEEFKEFDEEIETKYCCPSCGYRWSGKADGGGSPDGG